MNGPTERRATQANKVDIYATGLVYCSVCAPPEMEATEVERAVNAQDPTGIATPWAVDDSDWRSESWQSKRAPYFEERSW